MESNMEKINLSNIDIIQQKKEIRKKIKEYTSQIDEKTKKVNSELLANNFIHTADFKNSSLILLFQSLNDEISMEKLIEASIKANKTIAFPRISQDMMDFFLINSKTDFYNQFEKNKWNILEPKANLSKLNLTDFTENTIIFIPGLAFDSLGHRLGRGKGFYDKYLSELASLECFEKIKLIGVCNEKQILDNVPYEKHDFFVKYLLSEVAFRKIMPYN